MEKKKKIKTFDDKKKVIKFSFLKGTEKTRTGKRLVFHLAYDKETSQHLLASLGLTEFILLETETLRFIKDTHHIVE